MLNHGLRHVRPHFGRFLSSFNIAGRSAMAAAPVLRPYHSWSAPNSINGSPDSSPTRVMMSLQTQIEFYFSPQNLASDAYLRSQMDEERFVPIAVIAEFKMVKKVTSEFDLIIDAIRRSKLLEMNGTQNKVRASLKATERATIILRDIAADMPIERIRAIFEDEKCGKVVSIRADIGDTWFVSFADEDACMRTAQYLLSVTFDGQAIRFRVKSENLARAFHQEKLIAPSFIPIPVSPMFSVNTRPPSWNIRKVDGYLGDAPGVVMPSFYANRRAAAPQMPGDRRRPSVFKPRDSSVPPGMTPMRQPRRQRPLRAGPFFAKPVESCVDGVAPPVEQQPQPDLSLEHFPALSTKTPVSSCPPSPTKDSKSYAATMLEVPLASLTLDDESPSAGGQAAPASSSPSSTVEENRNETDAFGKSVSDKTLLSYASIARRAADTKSSLSD